MNGDRRLRRRVVPRAVAAALGLTLLATMVAAAQAPAGSDQSWIDTPLTASELPLETIDLVGHSTASAGVAHVELIADDEMAGEADPDGAPVLAAIHLSWSPPGPGTYLLVLRARDTDGAWGLPASVIVVIGDGTAGESPTPSARATDTPRPTDPTRATPKPTAKPTPRPTAKPTAKPTARPTPTPCPTPRPRLTRPADGTLIDDAADNPPRLQWTFRTAHCPVESFRLQVAYDPDFRDPVVDERLPGDQTSWLRRTGFADCSSVFWRVEPTFEGQRGSWSGTSTFEIRIGRCG